MMTVDQIHPFIPSQRVNRREKSKDEQRGPGKKPDDDKARKKRGPRDGHQVDELA
ncbi:MAG: hypothetical protein ACE5G3_08805 [Gammaproteobacteria bacterium]